MANENGKLTWHANYWKDEKHGTAWMHVKEAMKRDWEQTKSDVKAGGKDLNQTVGDTLSQCVGKEPIPPSNVANPSPKDQVGKYAAGPWSEVEPAFQYGFAARQEYGATYPTWDEKLEARLLIEWNDKRTGRSFGEVKPYIRRGWDKTA